MVPSIDININCDNDCVNWCPRRLVCCSGTERSKAEDKSEDIDIDASAPAEVKANSIANATLNKPQETKKKSDCQII